MNFSGPFGFMCHGLCLLKRARAASRGHRRSFRPGLTIRAQLIVVADAAAAAAFRPPPSAGSGAPLERTAKAHKHSNRFALPVSLATGCGRRVDSWRWLCAASGCCWSCSEACGRPSKLGGLWGRCRRRRRNF